MECRNKKESWHFMCNKRSNTKNMNDYLLCVCVCIVYDYVEKRIRGVWGEKPTRGNSLYRVVVSIEWLTGCLRLMGDSSVYSRFFLLVLLFFCITCVWLYYYIAVAELCAFVHAWEVILAVYNFIKSWRTGVRIDFVLRRKDKLKRISCVSTFSKNHRKSFFR